MDEGPRRTTDLVRASGEYRCDLPRCANDHSFVYDEALFISPESRMHSFAALLARRARTCWCAAVVPMIMLSARAEAQKPAAEPPRDSAKVALIRQLLDETHTVDLALTAMQASVSAQRTANPRIPAMFWDRLVTLAQSQRDTLSAMFIEIYSRHFSA